MSHPEKKSKVAALVLALVAGAFLLSLVAGAFRFDAWVREEIVASQGRDWKKSGDYRVWAAVSRYGDWPELMAMGGLGLFFSWRARNREWQRILVAAMVASTVAGLLVNALRLTTGRTRPRESPKIAQAWVGPYHDGAWTIGNSKYNSFPSGHTATAVGFAGVVLFARPLFGLAAMAGAFAIAWARMALGAHHFSDVTVAALAALVIAWLCWRRSEALLNWLTARFRKKS